jgi:hypothetical protein
LAEGGVGNCHESSDAALGECSFDTAAASALCRLTSVRPFSLLR